MRNALRAMPFLPTFAFCFLTFSPSQLLIFCPFRLPYSHLLSFSLCPMPFLLISTYSLPASDFPTFSNSHLLSFHAMRHALCPMPVLPTSALSVPTSITNTGKDTCTCFSPRQYFSPMLKNSEHISSSTKKLTSLQELRPITLEQALTILS